MSFSDYIRHGWKLCAITDKKGAVYDEWNTNPIPEDAADGFISMGLLHALSATCCIDLDNLEAARKWFKDNGVDIDAHLSAQDAVRIDSGVPNRAKLLYRLTRPLVTVKPTLSGVELRCATSKGTSVQDVLPPSIHPTTKKAYRWRYNEELIGDWRNLPAIPPNILNLWRELARPIAQSIEERPVPQTIPANLESLHEALNARDPDCGYDEWRDLGMRCHEGTDGHIDGFNVWNEWSAKSLKYPGKLACFQKYQTFSNKGEHKVTAAALIAEIPAKPEDFEEIPDEIANAPVAPPDPATKAGKAVAYREALFKRFVFVIGQELYYDRDRGCQIGDKAIQVTCTPFMPRKDGRLLDPLKELREHPDKVIVEALAFHPGEGHIFTQDNKQFANAYNAHMLPAPIAPMKDELEKIEWIFNRIEDVEFREWLRQFYAHVVQHPGVKIRSAPLLLSKVEGNGKSMTMHVLLKLLVGPAYYEEVNQAKLDSNHNCYLEGKWAMSLTEFKAASRVDREIIAKKVEQIIADDLIQMNPKNRAGYTVPNYMVVTASTNKPDAIQLDEYNRKWAIYTLTAPKMSEEEKTWIFEGFLKTDRARAVLRHYFLNVPITTFNPNADALRTADRTKMIRASTTQDFELMLTAFEQCSEPLSRDVVITQDVGDYVRRHCIAKPSNDRVGSILGDPPFNATPRKWQIGKAFYRGWILRNRAKWMSASAKELMAEVQGENVDITS